MGAATPVPHVGRLLADRWEVGPRIGVGGMASVHAGVDRRLGRRVAVKILHHHVAESAEARERLAREARAIAQLKHENIIEVYDYSIEDPDCTWLVTELIEGGSLRQFLDENETTPPEVAVMIAMEVVRALQAAHEAGVVHRDVKPDNILIGRIEGRPKLSDFGIAQVASEGRMTLTGNLVGSPSYMSPEQADGLRTDHRTDLFSSGILLYRMVTGTLPFRGQTPMDTIRRVAAVQYVDPMELAPNLPGCVAAIIRRALSARIEERYASAGEMLVDLGEVLRDAGLTATWDELPRFFAGPTRYWDASKPRLSQELEARGKLLLEAGRESRAVDCFNRALALGDGTQSTVDLVRQLSRRKSGARVRRFVSAAGLALGGVACITAVLLVSDLLSSSPPPPALLAAEPTPDPIKSPGSAGPVAPGAPEHRANDGPSETKPSPPSPAVPPAALAPPPSRPAPIRARPKPQRPSAPAQPRRPGTLQVGSDKWVDVFVDGELVGRAPDRTHYELAAGEHVLRAEKPNSNCLPFERPFTIRPGETTRVRLKVVCP